MSDRGHRTHVQQRVGSHVLGVILLLLAVMASALAACGPRDAGDGAARERPGAATIASDCNPVGIWRHEHAEYGSEIVICAQPDGTRHVSQAFDDGTTYVNALTPVASTSSERYLRDPAFSDYYELLADGRLVIGDEEGVIVTVDPVTP